ncbi:MAG: hypothetical protein QXX64_05235 [Nitrososphaera sp.]
MTRPIIVAVGALAVIIGSIAATPSNFVAYAQYGGDSGGGAATEDDLAQCAELGIPAQQCNEVNILAKQRLTTAQKTTYGNDPMGSGTSMIAQESTSFFTFVGILGAIFGGVAAAFFIRGRGSKQITP